MFEDVSLKRAFSLLGLLQKLLKFCRAILGVFSCFDLQEVSGVDGVHGIRVDRDKETRNGEGDESRNDEDQSSIVNFFAVAGHILDQHVDGEDCEEGNAQSNKEGEDLNRGRDTVWTTATIEVVPMLLRRIEKARPAAVQYESPARLITLNAPLLNHWKR